MKKKERNLLYPLPIAEVDEQRMKERIESVIGRPIEKINRNAAASYKGVLESAWDLRNIFDYKINNDVVHPGAFMAYSTQIPVPLSFALKHSCGVQHFTIIEKGKKGKPDATYDFGVTDVEFYEEYFLLFGIAKDIASKTNKEYLLYYLPEKLSFFKTDIQIRKIREEVYWKYNEKEIRRLVRLSLYAYKYLKEAHEIKLSRNTLALTGCVVPKPGKRMFQALSACLKKEDSSSEQYRVLKTTLDESFHRYLQTSLGNAHVSTIVSDSNGLFKMSMEKMTPCCDKKGFRFEGLRHIEDTPWNSYWMNVEYNYKDNAFVVYDKDWNAPLRKLSNIDNEEGKKAIQVIRKCVNSYFNATK